MSAKSPTTGPRLPITVGLGAQYTMLCIAGIVLTPMIMITLAGGSDAYLSWAVFAALIISGLTTAVQARKVGRTPPRRPGRLPRA